MLNILFSVVVVAPSYIGENVVPKDDVGRVLWLPKGIISFFELVFIFGVFTMLLWGFVIIGIECCVCNDSSTVCGMDSTLYHEI